MKLLIIRNDNIGDLVCTTPLIHVLREAYPDACFDLFGNSYNTEILKYDSSLSRIWSYRKAKHTPGFFKKLQAWIDKGLLLLRLRLRCYDLIIIAVPLFNERTMHLAHWIAPKKIYGAMPDRPLKSRLPKNYYPITIDHNEPHLFQVLSYAQALGIKARVPESIGLVLTQEEKKLASRQRAIVPGNSEKPLLGLQISSRRPKQQWPYAQWKELISSMLPHCRLRLFWSPGGTISAEHHGDDALAASLVQAFPTHALLAKPTSSLRELMIGLYGCDCIVGPDGGAMHVAAGLDIPTLTLFGDVDPSIWNPYSKKSYFIKSPSETLLDLTPCMVAERTLALLSSLPSPDISY